LTTIENNIKITPISGYISFAYYIYINGIKSDPKILTFDSFNNKLKFETKSIIIPNDSIFANDGDIYGSDFRKIKLRNANIDNAVLNNSVKIPINTKIFKY
jgi:hypothetical protein